MSDVRFAHTRSMAEMAVSLAECHGIDTDLTWKTAMLHDVVKELSADELSAVAARYGHEISDLSRRFRNNLHAEIGALIAEHEFGLKDRDALNAIRYHVCARPDMSTLEKIIYFSDFAEPTRPNMATMQYLYRVARIDLDEAIMRGLSLLLDYQITHKVDPDICEMCSNAFDFLLDERTRKKDRDKQKEIANPELLTDDEFDKAFAVISKNGIRLKSVENMRFLGGITTADGAEVRQKMVIRSGDLSRLTEEDARHLADDIGLTLVIDLRTRSETDKRPDVKIPGVRYVNIPLTESLDMRRMDQLTRQYQNSYTDAERAWYLAQYAGIDEVRQMYLNISVDPGSKDKMRQIFRLLIDNEGTVLFHCTSGKDRTGIVAALFLYSLGCSRDDVINDYNASAVSFAAKVEMFRSELREHGYSAELQRGIQTILSVVPEAIAAGFYYLNTRFVSAHSLVVDELGLTEEEYEAFKGKYLIR